MGPDLKGSATALSAAVVLAAGCAAGPGAAPPAGTVWEWSGERRITGVVEVPPGVTLRLRPGTRLAFAFADADGDGVGDAGLHVQGRLVAEGEERAHVVFTSAEDDPRPGDWMGLLFDDSAGNRLAGCRIEYAQYALHAHFSGGEVRRCRIERNVEGTRLGDSRFEIAYNLISGNASKGINFRACANRIHHNTITGNGNGIFLFETDTESVIERNNIYGNERYDLRLGDFYRGGAAVAGNWWGTADRRVIEGRVYDGGEDPALGRVAVDPAPAPVDTGWGTP